MTPVPILLYHSVSDQRSEKFARWSVSPTMFEDQMRAIRDGGFTPLTVTDFVRLREPGSAGLPARPVLITFDDGFADNYENALPILQKYGFPATLYVVTGYVGRTSEWLAHADESDRRMLTWAKVAEMDAAGVEIGAHTQTHRALDVLPAQTAWDEITRSKTELEQHLGHGISSFAYPHGFHGGAVARMVQKAGFDNACAVKEAMSSTTDLRFALARMFVTPKETRDVFDRMLNGIGISMAPQREQVKTTAYRLFRKSTTTLRRANSH